jgi:hypothetical protein
VGCDAPTESTSLDVTLTATPDPAQPTASTGVTYKVEGQDDEPDEIRTYPWKTSFVVNIQETGGLAVDITAVTLKVQQASGGIVIAPSGGEVEYFKFNSSASGNRVAANGSASVGFEVWYALPNEGREALVTVTLGFQDDDDRTYSDVIAVKVAP